MFSDPVQMHVANVKMALERNSENEQVPVAEVGLMLEPLTPELARELSDDIEAHCFDDDGEVRDEVSSMTFKLREPQQHVVAKMAIDVSESTATLRHVRPLSVSISKRGEDPEEGNTETKARKVKPGTQLLRATITSLVQPDDPATREFLMRWFKKTFFFHFSQEAQQLPFGPPPKAKAEKAQKPLEFEKKARIKKITDEQVQDAIAAASGETLELTAPHLKQLDQAHRRQILDWAAACDTVRTVKGDNLVAADLPPAPSFVLNPAELELKKDAPALDPAAGDVLDEQSELQRRRAAATEPPRGRGGRRGKFENKPRIAKPKKAGRKGARS